jgi:hypothetical protein
LVIGWVVLVEESAKVGFDLLEAALDKLKKVFAVIFFKLF